MTFICQPIPHMNEKGQTIIEFLPEYGDEPENFHRFVTDIQLIATDGQGRQHLAGQQRVPIEALDVPEAFEKLDGVCAAVSQEMVKAAQKANANKIIVPGQAVPPMIQNGQNGHHVNRLRMSE